ncbi:MATH domain-containing protein [archaeon]|nr:MAG: MATH domain-containing protein [archaeon]
MSAASGNSAVLSGKKRKINGEGPTLEVIGNNNHHNVSFLAKVKGFSKLPSEVGSHVRTNAYEMNGRLWGLKIFPGGSTSSFSNMVSVFLFCLSEIETRVTHRITVLLPNGTESPARHVQADVKEFCSGGFCSK